MSELIQPTTFNKNSSLPSAYSHNEETIPVQPKEFDLFAQGTLVHVGRLSRIQVYLSEGIYSPVAQARKAGKKVRNPGFWFPNDNLVVKFLKLESPDWQGNFRALANHFEMFGNFDDDRAIGFITRRSDAQRMAEGEPYFSFDDILPASALIGVLLPVIPMLRRDVDHMRSPINSGPAAIITQAVEQAVEQGTISTPFYIVDHFGRQLGKVA